MKLEDFKSFKIVVNSSDACILFASEELKKFIYESSGYALEIVNDSAEKGIYVGCGKVFCAEYLPDDSFSVVFENDNVYLLGKTSRSILYATYDFIEKFFGVRFLSVNHTYVPKITQLQASAFLTLILRKCLFIVLISNDLKSRLRNRKSLTKWLNWRQSCQKGFRSCGWICTRSMDRFISLN